MSPETIRRVLVVGSWAKEQITIEHLKRTSSAEVLAFTDTANPGIQAAADEMRVGDFHDVEGIAAYAVERGVDLVLITTASPLAHGVVDLLEERGIPAFGPTRAAARLEADKRWARELVAGCCPRAVPVFQAFEEPAAAVRFAESLGWRVAVKPIGLTDGLGVRVWGDQLRDPAEVREAIEAVFSQGIGGGSAVVVEEALRGEEFTIQALVNGGVIAPTPAVQDFKKLLPGGKGPNTASMGSYTDRGWILPIMTRRHYDEAVEIMKSTLAAAGEAVGHPCRGFLYGQFMITADGVKLIEYNFRPGDPEWMNTMAILRTPLLEAVSEVMAGRRPELDFDDAATVCKYIVPAGYPYELDQELPVELELDTVRALGVDAYHSCGEDPEGRLNVGTERGVAFVARAPSIEAAHRKVEEAIATVEGEFFHRPDIGTRALLDAKIRHLNRLRGQRAAIRPAREEEFVDLQGFVAGCPPLEPYAEHMYRILLRHFGSCSTVAEDGGRMLGFVMGFVSHRFPGTYFLWQIGVAPDLQGSGLGRRLLADLEGRLLRDGVRRIEVTIDPMNDPSRRLFEHTGYVNISDRVANPVEVNRQIAAADFYRPSRHFMVFEKHLAAE